jgi:aspartate ammonia-lyase
MSTRIEKDLIGSLPIEQASYFGIHTQRAINNFTISEQKIGDYPLFIQGMAMVKKACALANQGLKTLSADKAALIIKACDHLLNNLSRFKDSFPIDVFQGGAGTSVNMNMNEVLANIALELGGFQKGDYLVIHPNDDINQSQSTNDAYPTSLRLALCFYLKDLLSSIQYLIDQLEIKAIEFNDILKMGRTQLQDAVPMSLGQEILGWSVNLKEEIKNIERTRDLLLEINLGATAIGTGVNAPEGFTEEVINHLARMTGLQLVTAENLIEATSDCGAYVMLSGALKRFSVKLSKICNDLRLLSSGPRCGFNEINLPQLQAGSSIMPAKVNPVIPEVVNQVCYKVMGNDTTVTFAAEAGQLQLNVMEPVIAQSLFESIDLLNHSCLSLADRCIKGMTANKDRCREMVFQSVGLITFLNPYIGHEQGDRIGQIALESGRSIREIVLSEQLLSEKELDQILSTKNLINPHYKASMGNQVGDETER